MKILAIRLSSFSFKNKLSKSGNIIFESTIVPLYFLETEKDISFFKKNDYTISVFEYKKGSQLRSKFFSFTH